MKKPRVLLADDHKAFLEQVRLILEPEFEVVADVADGAALIAAAVEFEPDILIVDIAMPIVNGIEAVETLRLADSDAKILFLTAYQDADYRRQALAVGAQGFVTKDCIASELAVAVRRVLAGRTYISTVARRF